MTASRQSSLAVQGLGLLESLWSRGEEGLLFSGVLPATHNCRCGGSRRMEALPLEPKFPGAPET